MDNSSYIGLKFLLCSSFLIVLPFFIAFQYDNFSFESSWGSFTFTILIALLLSYYGFVAKAQPVTLMFLLFVYVFFGVIASLQLGLSTFSWGGTYTENEIFNAGLVLAVGLAGYFLGKNKKYYTLRLKSDYDYFIDARVLFFFSLLFIPIIFKSLASMGGWVRLTTPRSWQGEIADYDSVTYVLSNSGLYVPTIFFSLIFLSMYIRKSTALINSKLYAVLGCLLWLPLAIIVCNPIGTARYIFGSFILSILFVVFYRWRANIVLLMVVALLAIFPLADAFRDSLNVSLSGYNAWVQLVEKPDYDAYQQLLNAVRYVDIKGVEYGWQFLGAVLFFIPRSVWPGKPISSGEMIGEWAAYPMFNLSMPAWGDFYLDGSYLFVFFIFYLYGRGVGYLEFIGEDNKSPFFVFEFMVFFASYQLFFLRGSMSVTIAYLTPYVGMFLLCYLVARKKNKHEDYDTSS